MLKISQYLTKLRTYETLWITALRTTQ